MDKLFCVFPYAEQKCLCPLQHALSKDLDGAEVADGDGAEIQLHKQERKPPSHPAATSSRHCLRVASSAPDKSVLDVRTDLKKILGAYLSLGIWVKWFA